jgi:hypothetical protein
MLHEVSTEQQPARLAHLLAQFRRAIDSQRRRDAELVAGLERVSHNPRVRQIIRQIIQENGR